MAFRQLTDGEYVTVDTSTGTSRWCIPLKVSGVLQTKIMVLQAYRKGSEVALYGLNFDDTHHLENGVHVPDHVSAQWRQGLNTAAIQLDL